MTEEQNCEEEVFPLSVIYLDQTVSVLTIRKTQLQLVACACMFVASKFRETNHLSSKILVMYSDCSITVDQLLVLLHYPSLFAAVVKSSEWLQVSHNT